MIWNQQVVAYLSCHLKASKKEEEEMHSKWTCETFSFLTFWSTQALHNPHMSSEIIIQITQPVKSMKDFNTSTLTCFHPKNKKSFQCFNALFSDEIDPRVSLKVVICVVHDTMKGWSFHNLSSPIRGYNTTKAKVARVHRKVANILHFLPNQVGYWDCNG